MFCFYMLIQTRKISELVGNSSLSSNLSSVILYQKIKITQISDANLLKSLFFKQVLFMIHLDMHMIKLRT